MQLFLAAPVPTPAFVQPFAAAFLLFPLAFGAFFFLAAVVDFPALLSAVIFPGPIPQQCQVRIPRQRLAIVESKGYTSLLFRPPEAQREVFLFSYASPCT